jgi:hypothetical protein
LASLVRMHARLLCSPQHSRAFIVKAWIDCVLQ